MTGDYVAIVAFPRKTKQTSIKKTFCSIFSLLCFVLIVALLDSSFNTIEANIKLLSTLYTYYLYSTINNYICNTSPLSSLWEHVINQVAATIKDNFSPCILNIMLKSSGWVFLHFPHWETSKFRRWRAFLSEYQVAIHELPFPNTKCT